jgi:ribonuclease HI
MAIIPPDVGPFNRAKGASLCLSAPRAPVRWGLPFWQTRPMHEHMDGFQGQRKRSESGVKTVVWTDGSCNANGVHGRGGWAALIEQAGTVREISDSAHGTTHNRMELTAICEALETLTGAIEVRTDSTYVEKCFNQNWHERWLRDGSWKGSNGPVKNRDLWERLFGLKWDGRRDVTFVWIRGHAGDPNNHRVDRLARAAALSAG